LLWANTQSQVIVVPTELTGLLRACFLPPTFANCYAVCWGVFGAPIQAALAGGVLKHAVWFPERLPQPSRLDAKCLAESSSGETRVTYYVSLGPCSGEPRAHVVASARESVGAAADMDDGKWWKKSVPRFCFCIYFLGETGLGLQTKSGYAGIRKQETNQYMDGSSTKTVRWQKLKPEYHTRLLRARTLAVGLLYRQLHFHASTATPRLAAACRLVARHQQRRKGLGDHAMSICPPTCTCTRAIYTRVLTLEVQKQQN
jgi:hypothetical protein